MIKGYLILNGGEAFSPRTKTVDHTWLRLVQGQSRPRVVVVPVAAVAKAEKTAIDTVRYFKNLYTFPEYVKITDQLSANTRTECEILDKVEAIVLTDGSPIDMVERLTGTRAEAALRRALERKAAVMATGASAMALGAAYWFANEWEKGLGLVPHMAILPHHNLIRMRLPPEKLLSALPEGLTLTGIDEATTLICHPDGTYQAIGEGTVTVYRSVEQLEEYQNGMTFMLGTPGAE